MPCKARPARRWAGGVFLAAMSLIAAALLPAVPADAQTPAKEYGVWFWSSPAATPPAISQGLLDAAKAAGFTAVYVTVDDALPILNAPLGPERTRRLRAYGAAVSAFITYAGHDGLAVDAVSGEPDWAEPRNRAAPFRILNWVTYYNRAHAAKFRNTQYDVEPYSLPQWKTDEVGLLTDYVGFVNELVTRNHSGGGIEMVIPFFYGPDNRGTPDITWRGRTASPFALILAALDRKPGDAMLMMAYRNVAEGRNGTLGLSAAAMALASQAGHATRLIIAQETSDVRPAEITYFGTSKAYLGSQVALIDAAYAGSAAYGGIAIEYIQPFLALP